MLLFIKQVVVQRHSSCCRREHMWGDDCVSGVALIADTDIQSQLAGHHLTISKWSLPDLSSSPAVPHSLFLHRLQVPGTVYRSSGCTLRTTLQPWCIQRHRSALNPPSRQLPSSSRQNTHTHTISVWSLYCFFCTFHVAMAQGPNPVPIPQGLTSFLPFLYLCEAPQESMPPGYLSCTHHRTCLETK